MSQGDKFHQYGYDHYLKVPKKSKSARSEYQSGKTGLLRNMQSPAVASIVLFVAAILFIWAVVSTYPSDDGRNHSIPIVKADLRPVKQKPEKAGGMDIPNRKSTILARSDYPTIKDDKDKIENLLAMKDDTPPISKAEIISGFEKRLDADINQPSLSEKGLVLPKREKALEVDTGVLPVIEQSKIVSIKPIKPEFEIKEPVEPKVSNILQKIGSTKNDKISDIKNSEFEQKVAKAAIVDKPRFKRSRIIHDTGRVPETIDYVRSVLGKNDGGVAPHNIEPAAGIIKNPEITSGIYFVQLASITDPKRASNEWKKMQKKYPVLMQSKFRIQEASLNSGRFYRIQAGPMSKTSASQICEELKRAKKPGGCLVVK